MVFNQILFCIYLIISFIVNIELKYVFKDDERKSTHTNRPKQKWSPIIPYLHFPFFFELSFVGCKEEELLENLKVVNIVEDGNIQTFSPGNLIVEKLISHNE